MTKRPQHDLPDGHLDCCQICGSEQLVEIIKLGHHAPCDSLLWPEQLRKSERTYPLDLVRCEECSLVQINYAVAADELFFSGISIQKRYYFYVG